jgi:signal transduction histidine kinase/ActR/RegA family two-component response regulator
MIVAPAIGNAIACVLLLLSGLISRAEVRSLEPLPSGKAADFSWTISALDDATGALGAGDVLTPEHQRRLRPVDALGIYDTKVARWFQLRIDNPRHRPLAVNIKKSSYASLQIFENLALDQATYVKTFDLAQKSWRDIFNPHYVHFLGDHSQQSTTVILVRITAATRLILPVKVLARDQATSFVAMVALALGAYYGSIFVMLFYNAFLYFFINDRVYLAYAIYLAAFALTQMSVDGFLPVLFQWLDQIWTGHIGVIFGTLTLIFLTLYTRIFLGLRREFPRLDVLALASVGIYSLLLVAVPVLPYSIGVNTVYCFNFLCSIVLLILGFGAYLGGYKPARYFILGNMLLIVASILMALLLLRVVSIPLLNAETADYLVKLGSALEVVFFSFALADRVNMMAKEQERSQRSLHEAEVNRLESEKRAARETAKANQYMVLAQMTQTLAHDIRKPFSMLKIGLDRVATLADDPRDVKDTIAKIRFHVGKAFEDVNRMIGDVMEASSGPANLHLEAHSLRGVTAAALAQTFRYHQNVAIDFSIHLQHRHLCRIDEFKVQRVFVNILDNARQAMGGKGVIGITTRDVATDAGAMVEVTIRNSGSAIAGEDLEHIFEPFFTKGKKGGTGLGLAICRKIVEAHGGRIGCSSSQAAGTEFAFTVPALRELDATVAALPSSSAMIRQDFEKTLAGSPASALTDLALHQRKRIGLARMARIGRPFKVLIVDDESIYAEGIKSLVNGDADLRIDFIYVETPAQALAVVEGADFDLIICDIDFPDSEITGFEIIDELRRLDGSAKICIHSNRVLPADYRRAMDAGADAYLPKPMTYPHLIGLLVGDEIADASA